MQRKLIKAAFAALMLFVASLAHAGILYTWGAECVSRNILTSATVLEFGCNGPLTGTFEAHER